MCPKLTFKALRSGTDSSRDSYIFRFWKAFRRTILLKVCLSIDAQVCSISN